MTILNIKRNYLFILLSLTLLACSSQSQSHSQLSNEKIENSELKLNFKSAIRVIFKDKKGNYWFGSHNEGICLFDGKSFKYFTTDDGLSDNQIRSIQEGNMGDIWIETARGVDSYDGEKMISHTSQKMIGLPVKNVWAKTSDDLWFGAGNKTGVYRYDGQKMQFLKFSTPEKTKSFNPYSVTGISKGKNNMQWIATYAGVFGYDGKSFTLINDETLGYKVKKDQLHIRSIFEDSKGNLWIGNNGIGVLLYNDGITINFSQKMGLTTPDDEMGLPSPSGTLQHVFSIEEDTEGNIWFGDRDTDVWKYDGEKMSNYSVEDGLPPTPEGKMLNINSICQVEDGDLLFGMANGSVYIFNGKGFERKY